MYVLGLDVGTSGVKAILIDSGGNIIAKGYRGYGLITASGGIVEQDANEWWNASVDAVRQACFCLNDKSKIKAMALSTQGASSLLIDSRNEPLCNAITWMDKRSSEEKRALQLINTDDQIFRKTGWPLNESLDACKLLWLRNNKKDLLSKAVSFVSTIEFMHVKLTGRNIIDPCNAAIRQLMNIRTQKWDEEILDFIGESKELLPDIMPVGTYIGNLTESAADSLGLTTSVSVYNGAHDQYCAALGAGAINIGDMVISTGTAWVTLCITCDPLFADVHISPAKHIIGDLWGALTAFPVSGAALDWFSQIVKDDYENINIEAALRTQSAKDILFFPYFIGGGFPVRNPNAKAAFIGLSLNHDRYDLFRAIMEGVVFQLQIGVEQLFSSGVKIEKLMVVGGAAKSDLWMKILTAVVNVPIYKIKETDAACIGAATIAAVGAHIFENYSQAISCLVKTELLAHPDMESIEFYKDKYARFKNAWMNISNVYNQ